MADWRNGAVLVTSVAVALVALTVLDARSARQEARDIAREALADSNARAERINRHIDLLNSEIGRLNDQASANAAVIGELREDVRVLRRQIAAQGDEPAVDDPDTRPATGTTTSTTAAQPPPTTTRPPSEDAPPPPDGGFCILDLICIGD